MRSASPSSAAVGVDVRSVDSVDGVDANVDGWMVVGDETSVDTDMVEDWLVLVDDESLNAADASAPRRMRSTISAGETD